MSPPGPMATHTTGGSTSAELVLVDDGQSVGSSGESGGLIGELMIGEPADYVFAGAPRMTKAIARRMTDYIRLNTESLWDAIVTAYRGRVWIALGYSSWDDYCTHEFGTSRLRLPREGRPEVVASLRESGLSDRAIESVTGVSRRTLIRDRQSGGDIVTTSESVVDGRRVFTDDDVEDWVKGRTGPVIGLDGKTYQPKPPVPQPDAAPSRKSFAEVVDYRLGALSDDIGRLEQLIGSDRFRRNRAQIEGVEKLPDILHRFSARLDAIAELGAGGP